MYLNDTIMSLLEGKKNNNKYFQNLFYYRKWKKIPTMKKSEY